MSAHLAAFISNPKGTGATAPQKPNQAASQDSYLPRTLIKRLLEAILLAVEEDHRLMQICLVQALLLKK